MAATTLLTSDQFLALPEEFDPQGNTVREELIHGETVGISATSKKDAVIRSNILELLLAYLGANHLAMKVLSRATFVLNPTNVFVPDVSVLATGRINSEEHECFQGVPDLAIEVISHTDLEIQLRHEIDTYSTVGSQSVWMVYPGVRSVVVYRAQEITNLKANQPITDPLLPGFSSPVAAFFELT